MVIRKAKVTEAKQIKELIDDFAKEGMMLSRSLDSIYATIRDFSVCLVNNNFAGISALSVFTEELAEIRSVAVRKDYRNRKIGQLLIKNCMAEAREYNLKSVFTLTYIPTYFQKLGFQLIPKENLPNKIWRDCINCAHFYNCDEEALIIHLT